MLPSSSSLSAPRLFVEANVRAAAGVLVRNQRLKRPYRTLSPERNTPVAEDTQDHAEVRLEKLRAIEALGLDPWGARFDNVQPIAQVVALPTDVPPNFITMVFLLLIPYSVFFYFCPAKPFRGTGSRETQAP